MSAHENALRQREGRPGAPRIGGFHVGGNAHTPDEPRMVGSDATDGAGGGAVASAAVRARPSVAVPGTARPSQEQGRDGRSNAESGAALFPVPATASSTGAIATHDTIPPLQPALSTGFDSWAQVLTDWRVSRAFDASPFPRCFAAQPELAAPFVTQISRAICERQLRHPPSTLVILQECVVEPTYDRSGGPNYVALRDAMEAAQERYFVGLRTRQPERDPASPITMPAEVGRLQSAFFTWRQRHAPDVEHAQRAIARDYWKKHPRHGLGENFFDEVATESVPARMARIDPAWWWRRFFTKLQSKCRNHHAADGRFLDTLPMLRAHAKKKTLAAHIAEWCETRAAEWGWAGPGHYRMLADRAGEKADEMVTWFQKRAPGYLGTLTIRHSLDVRLNQFLAEHDPHTRLVAAERNGPSEHWRN